MAQFIIIPDSGPVPFIMFDLVESETHGREQSVTQIPVEQGVAITDHVREKPVKFSCVGFVTETPLVRNGLKNRGAYLPMTLDYATYDPPFNFTPGAIFREIGDFLSDLFGSPKQTPPIVLTNVLQFAEFQGIAEMQADLDQLFGEGAVPCDIVSLSKYYDTMMLTKYNFTRGIEDGVSITLEFQRINIVESETVDAPKPKEPRGAKAANGGASVPGDTPEARLAAAAKQIQGILGATPGSSFGVQMLSSLGF